MSFSSAIQILARPAEIIYRTGSGIRNLLYDFCPGLSGGPEIPLICVGNLTTGGTGKTPMVMLLARHFLAQGKRVGILSRGYGRRQPTRPVEVAAGIDLNDPQLLGDEAAMIKNELPAVILVLDRDRRRGAARLEKLGANIIIMDDGFQHRRLRRSFNLVMIDSQRIFGNRHLLPVGRLRESLSALQRAQAVVFNKFDLARSDFATQAAVVFAQLPASRIFHSSYIFNRLCSLSGSQSDPASLIQANRRLAAFAGLANNDYFFSQLEKNGFSLSARLSLADHYRYQTGDIARLQELAGEQGCLLTTMKDAAKLRQLELPDKLKASIYVLTVELRLARLDDLLALIERTVSGHKDGMNCRNKKISGLKTAADVQAGNKPSAVFLDRDGTIIREVNYLRRLEDIELLPGAAAAIRRLNQAGILVIVVSNQSGVARGFFDLDFVAACHRHLRKLLGEQGARIDDFFFCPHHPEAGQKPWRQNCDCRKPEPGLLLAARKRHRIDLQASYVIGDKICDLELADRVGGRGILVRTGHGLKESKKLAATDPRPVCTDLWAAVELVLGKG